MTQFRNLFFIFHTYIFTENFYYTVQIIIKRLHIFSTFKKVNFLKSELFYIHIVTRIWEISFNIMNKYNMNKLQNYSHSFLSNLKHIFLKILFLKSLSNNINKFQFFY